MNNNTIYQITLSHLQQIINTYIESEKAKRGIHWDGSHWMITSSAIWSLKPRFRNYEVNDALIALGYKKKRLRIPRENNKVTVYVSDNWQKWNRCSEWNQIGF